MAEVLPEVLLEVCVDNATGLGAAIAGGADRIELCAALDVGGLTPSAGFMALAATCGVPVMPLIRPRSGGFVYSAAEITVMLADITSARRAGMAGVVIGAAQADGRLDLAALSRMVAAAEGMSLTLHRVFDMVPDFPEALEQAIALGFHRILTSGGATSVTTGAAMLGALYTQAAGRITIMPGGGAGVAAIPALRAALPLTELHGSFSAVVPVDRVLQRFGMAGEVRQTQAALVAGMKQALRASA